MSEPTPPQRRQADGVDVVAATAADLQMYTEANRQLGQMRVPVLVSDDKPNQRLFVAVLDGTGNDMNNPEMGERTGISRVFEQIRDQQNRGELTNVGTAYLAGPGTGPHRGDMARGHTFEERAETMYQQFIEQAARWKRENPDAEISVATLGFSRGGEQAAYFTRLVHERGIQDPAGAVYTYDNTGLVTSVSYTRPPLVAPGEVVQAVVLQDPVVGAMSDPANYDRRLPASVVAALQITARDETRDQFQVSRHLPHGLSDDNRSLNVTVPGAHSNIGDGYAANGLGVRNTNMTMQFINGLVDNDRPLLQMRPEAPLNHPSNVIHDSEQHMGWLYTEFGFRDGVRNERTDLAPQPSWFRTDPALTRREPIDEGLSGSLDYRTLPMAPVPAAPTESREGRVDGAGPPHGPSPQTERAGAMMPANPFFEQLGGAAQRNDADGMRQTTESWLKLDPGGQAWGRFLEQYSIDQQARSNPQPGAQQKDDPPPPAVPPQQPETVERKAPVMAP